MAITSNMTPEAKQYLLSVLFRGVEPTRQMWVGLARRPLDEITSRSLAALEPSSGYSRQTVFPLDWNLEGETVVTKETMFENMGRDIWPAVEISFLSTSRDGNGVLLAWAPLEPPRVVLPGDRLIVAMRVGW